MKKILVVDDEPDLQDLVSQRFRRQIRDGSMTFVFATDGLSALETLEQHADVDLVLSDINMPRMDGLTLLSRLQEKEDKLATVIVSAYGDMANIRIAMNRGAFDFVTKPIDFADLETTIIKTISHVDTLREARKRQSEAERAHASLSRYFSPNLAKKLASDAASLAGGGERRQVAALFTDIAGFTSLVEKLDPAMLSDLLNDYLFAMTEIVFEYEGTVAKIVGDAIHILFGAPADQHDHATRAVACALALDVCAEDLRQKWRSRGVDLGVTRIGAHAGPAVVGNFGGGRFFDYTAYGDTINTAARLESCNKELGTRICVSAAIANEAADFRGRPIGNLLLRGRATSLKGYEPMGHDRYEAPATSLYINAFSKLEAGDAGAMPAFAALVGAEPHDQLANYHLKRLLNGASGAELVMR